ncbi:NUDIX domain-containing protein [Patescibacteria group bacterium]
MSEIINTYKLDDPETPIPMDRKEFYAEQVKIGKEGKKPNRANEIIDIFIFNSSKELLVQKRSYDKAHNPGLLDKSIGGHVRFGDTPDYTVMVETVQELQTPSIVLKNTSDFKKTLVLLEEYLTTISIIKHSKSKVYFLKKIIDGKNVLIANKIHAYFGIYDGSIKTVDKEAKGILFYTMEELKEEMKRFPKTFTDDMHTLLPAYEDEIYDFFEFISSKGIKKSSVDIKKNTISRNAK